MKSSWVWGARLVALALGLGLTACGGDDEEPRPELVVPAGSVTGRVVLFDSLSHEGTSIRFVARNSRGNIQSEFSSSVMSAADGGFEFRGIPAGTYDVFLEHDTYVTQILKSMIVGDLRNGGLDLGRHVLTRAEIRAGGQVITPGNKSPDVSKQFFSVDGRLGVYSHADGSFASLPPTFPAVGGVMTPDAQFALVESGTAATVNDPNTLFSVSLTPAADGNLPEPTLVSSNAVVAGVAPTGGRGFFLTPTGTGTEVDLWSFAFADPATATRVDQDLPSGSLQIIADPNYPTTAPYTRPVHSVISYFGAQRQEGGTTVRDFFVFDPATGGKQSLTNVTASSTLPTPPNYPTGLPDPLLITRLAGTSDRDLYLWIPGPTLPVKVTPTPLTGTYYVDASTTNGRVYIIRSAAGVRAVDAFDVAAAPNYRADVYTTVWSSTTLSGLLASGMMLDANKSLVLSRNGAMTDLAVFDVSNLSTTVVQANISKASGLPFNSGDSLASTDVLRPLGSGRYLFSTGSNGVTLSLGVIGGTTAIAIPGTFNVASWNSFKMAPAGTRAVFYNEPDNLRVVTFPAGAAPSVLTVPVVGATAATPLAVASDGSRIAYALLNVVTTMLPDGTGPVSPITSTSNVAELQATQAAVYSRDIGNEVRAAKLDAVATNVVVPTAAASFAVYPFTGGLRSILLLGNILAYDVDVTTVPAATYRGSTTPSQVYTIGGGARIAMVMSGQQLIVEDAAGALVTPAGAWYPLMINAQDYTLSPDGARAFFRRSTGLVESYGASGVAVEAIKYTPSLSTSYVRLLKSGMELVAVDYDNGAQQLVTVDRNTGVRQVREANLVGTSFQSSLSSNLFPWVSPDSTQIIYATDVNAAQAGMPPAYRLMAYGAAPIALGDNVATAPAPSYDSESKTVLFATDKESQFGTTTRLAYTLGAPNAVVIAEAVRSVIFSPDNKAMAVIVVSNGALELRSGNVGQPAVPMGPIRFTSLSNGSNVVWSDDSRRLFAIDTNTSGGNSTPGALYTGAVGQPGLLPVTTDVVAVFPDKTGARAAVLTRDLSTGGRLLQRFAIN